MSDPKPIALGIIIRQDGTIPIDTEVPEHHRQAIRQWLENQGHDYEHVSGSRHFKIRNWK
jgi:hypothetical protein